MELFKRINNKNLLLYVGIPLLAIEIASCRGVSHEATLPEAPLSSSSASSSITVPPTSLGTTPSNTEAVLATLTLVDNGREEKKHPASSNIGGTVVKEEQVQEEQVQEGPATMHTFILLETLLKEAILAELARKEVEKTGGESEEKSTSRRTRQNLLAAEIVRIYAICKPLIPKPEPKK